MNLLAEIRSRFADVLAQYVEDPSDLIDLVRRSQDAKFGDYQANVAMPLGKRLSRPPRDIAAEIVEKLEIDDLCEQPEVAGPGFINLRIRDARLVDLLTDTAGDQRLGVPRVEAPRTYVVDYSAPNVAKPMHVGHIRSTVIGDALVRTLRFLGHQVIGDNHIGDWGTQFGMIIYGYRHFLDEEAYAKSPVRELARLYRLVNQLVEYHACREKIPELKQQIAQLQGELEQSGAEAASGDKKAKKARRRLESRLQELRDQLREAEQKVAAVDADPMLAELARQHADVGEAVLRETARLHAGDEENLKLWRQFMPACLREIERVYERLGVKFDVTLGESFYHDQLPDVVADLKARGLAVESDGAVCIFLENSPAPMIIQKKDGAYLYATTDLATIRYRMKTWSPDAILYVVDHRQSLHFEQLFAVARKWGYTDVELTHVSFGTVLGEDGRPFKTRSGDTVGLEGLLDEAVRRARRVVAANDDAKPGGPELSEAERDQIAEVVGIGALKYADLMHNRTSDYVFSYEKMLNDRGDSATYLQYAYARVRSIFARGNVQPEALYEAGASLLLETPEERGLAMQLLRFAEALEQMLVDYRPNVLTAYLFEVADRYFSPFYDRCPVLKAENPRLRDSRLLLCDLTARVLKQGLALLGIQVVEKM